jgi:cytochrome c-type biogenesis protein CcmH/NrfF
MGLRSWVISMRLVFLLLALLSLSGLVRAESQTSELDTKATRLYQEIFSPFCPGRSLNDCPSQRAQELKLEIRKRLGEGEGEDLVLEGVIARFGEQYRAVPRYSGFGRLVWWGPLGFLVLGSVLAVWIARFGRGAGGRGDNNTADVKEVGVSSEVARRIEAELERIGE